MLIYVALALVLFGHVWSADPSTTMPLGGDQWRTAWFLEWTPWSILHGTNPLYSAAANSPYGVNVLVNAGSPLLGLLFSPVTLLFGPVAAFNVASTVSLAASAGGAYMLVRRLTTWRPAAFVAGLFYGFSPQQLAHAGEHLNLTFTPLVPLIFLVLHELLVTQTRSARPTGAILGALLIGQFFVSSEILFDTVVVGALAVVVAAGVGRATVRAKVRHAATGLMWAAGLAVVALAWPAWFLARGPAHVDGPVQTVAQAYRSDLLGLVVPDGHQLLHVDRWLAMASHFASSTTENGSYLGLPLLLLLAVGVLWRRRNAALVVGSVTAAGAFVLSLGGALSIRGLPELGAGGTAHGDVPLPQAALYKLPLLQNMIPARVALLVALLVSVAGGILLDELHTRLAAQPRRWSAIGLPIVVAAVALVPVLPAGVVGDVGNDQTPSYFTSVMAEIRPGAVALVFPFPSGAFPQPMLWQAEAHFRFTMPGGSYFVPQGSADHVAFSPALAYTRRSVTATVLTQVAQGSAPPRSAALRSSLLAQWRAWRVDTVVAVPADSTDPAGSMAFLRWVLGPPVKVVAGCVLWRTTQRPA